MPSHYLARMHWCTKSLMGLSFALLASCGEQPAREVDPGGEAQAGAVPASFADPLVARLAKGDPTICADEAVQRLVVSQTLAQVDKPAVEKYRLLLSGGDSLDFVGARLMQANPGTREVTCSAALPAGYTEKPFRFTYVLRADQDGSSAVVAPDGQVDRWFHFRGAIVSKLAEKGLMEGSGPPRPVPPVDLELTPPPPSDDEEAPISNAAEEVEPLDLPPMNEWNGVGR